MSLVVASLPAVRPVGCLAHLAGHRGDGLPEGLPQLQTRGPAGQPDPREGPAAGPLLAPQLRPQDRLDLGRQHRRKHRQHSTQTHKGTLTLNRTVLSPAMRNTNVCLRRQSKSIGFCSH